MITECFGDSPSKEVKNAARRARLSPSLSAVELLTP